MKWVNLALLWFKFLLQSQVGRLMSGMEFGEKVYKFEAQTFSRSDGAAVVRYLSVHTGSEWGIPESWTVPPSLSTSYNNYSN